MDGVWFAAMVAILVGAGVAAQLGWQLPPIAEVKRVLKVSRPRREQPSVSAAVIEPR